MLTCFSSLLLLPAAIVQANNQAGFDASRHLTHKFLNDTGEAAYSGTVQETFNSGGYTYLRFKSADKEYWAASGAVSVKPGDQIVLDEVYPMHGFYSKSLDREFDFILFTSQIMKKN